MLSLYKIFKEGDENFYIGSTNNMYKRMIVHKSYCKTKDFKLYKYIRANGGWDSWNMEKIGECGSLAGEIKLIKEKKPSLNTLMYEFDNKEYMKEHRQKNKEYNREYFKRYNDYRASWGGYERCNNNLLQINPNLFD